MALAFYINLPLSQPMSFLAFTLLIITPILLETGVAILLEKHTFVIFSLQLTIPCL